MKNIAASIRAQLLNQARTSQEEFGPVLERYAIGRLIYRLSQSNYADQFILKGAQLFSIWTTEGFRPTRDADFLGLNEFDEGELESSFAEICTLSIFVPCPFKKKTDLSGATYPLKPSVRMIVMVASDFV